MADVAVAVQENSRVASLRRIVRRRQFEKIDDSIVDLFSASAILKVFDALEKPENKQKYMAMDVRGMSSVAWKLVK